MGSTIRHTVQYYSFYPILCCSLILLQGAAYWGICLNRIKRKARRTKKLAAVYKIFRFINLMLLLFYLFIAYYSWEFEIGLLIGAVIYIFAILEYINYFYFRLAYPVPELISRAKHLKFDKSQIAKELCYASSWRRRFSGNGDN